MSSPSIDRAFRPAGGYAAREAARVRPGGHLALVRRGLDGIRANDARMECWGGYDRGGVVNWSEPPEGEFVAVTSAAVHMRASMPSAEVSRLPAAGHPIHLESRQSTMCTPSAHRFKRSRRLWS